MSGIFGAWNLDERPLDPVELRRLSAALAHRGEDGDGTFIAGAAAVGCRLRRVTPESAAETQPYVTPRQTAVVFDGRLDNRDVLLAAVQRFSDIASNAPDAALVAAAYECFGGDVAHQLAGDFAAAILDFGRRRLLLVRDAIGVKPLYYFTSDVLFLFASEIKSLLSHPSVPSAPDDDAIATFVQSKLHAQLADGATFFKRIKSLPPAHLAVVGRDGCRLQRYWDFDTGRYASPRSAAERRETFVQLLKTSIRRRLRSAGPVAVSVSGGVDSSSIFCVAEELRRERHGALPPVLGCSNTHEAGSRADESRYLSCLEERWPGDILRIPTCRSAYADSSFPATWHGEAPFIEGQWETVRRFGETLRARGVRRVLGGHWGDQLLDNVAFLVDLMIAGKWTAAWKSISAHAQWDTESRRPLARLARQSARTLIEYCAPDSARRVLRRLGLTRSGICAAQGWYSRAIVRRDLRFEPSAARRLRSSHQRSLHREARSQYHVLCMEWNDKIAAAHGLEMAFPFLDRDLVEFLISVPGHEQMPGGVHKQLLRDSMRGLVPDAIIERRDKGDSTEVVNEGLRGDRMNVLRWLGRDAMVIQLGYAKPDLPARLGERWRDGHADAEGLVEWAVTDLLALEIWLQSFFGVLRKDHATPVATAL